MECLAHRHRTPLPTYAVSDRELAAPHRESRVFVRPVEKPGEDDGIAGVLAEQMAFVARVSGTRIIVIDVGAVVIDELAAVDEPQSSAVADERGDMRPWTRLGDGHELARRSIARCDKH